MELDLEQQRPKPTLHYDHPPSSPRPEPRPIYENATTPIRRRFTVMRGISNNISRRRNDDNNKKLSGKDNKLDGMNNDYTTQEETVFSLNEVIIDYSANQEPESPMSEYTGFGYNHSNIDNLIACRSALLQQEQGMTMTPSRLDPQYPIAETKTNESVDHREDIETSEQQQAKELQEQSKDSNNTTNAASCCHRGVRLLDMYRYCWSGSGIRNDLNQRMRYHYKDDWKLPIANMTSMVTILNAAVIAFVQQLIPSLVFATLLHQSTNGNVSYNEIFVSTILNGIIYIMCSGQPLLLIGVTGPITLFLCSLYTDYGSFLFGYNNDIDSTTAIHDNYYAFYFWICIWACLLNAISSFFGFVSFVRKLLTPFIYQILDLFVSISFIYLSVYYLIEPLHTFQVKNDDDNDEKQDYSAMSTNDRSNQYVAIVLGIITCCIALKFNTIGSSIYLTRSIRNFLSSYNLLITCIIVTGISYLPGIDQDNTVITINNKSNEYNTTTIGPDIDRINIQWDWKPSSTDRSWITGNPIRSDFHHDNNMHTNDVFKALVPGLMLYILSMVCHNLCSIKLLHEISSTTTVRIKPVACQWDFLILGITFIPCGIFGLPPCNGIIDATLVYARALQHQHREEQRCLVSPRSNNTNKNNNNGSPTNQRGNDHDEHNRQQQQQLQLPSTPTDNDNENRHEGSTAYWTTANENSPDNKIDEDEDASIASRHESIEEQRWSGVGQSLLLLGTLVACSTILSLIPLGCIFGFLLYFGISALYQNEIWLRIITYSCMTQHNRLQRNDRDCCRSTYPIVQNVSWSAVQLYTFIQLVLSVTLFGISQFTKIGYMYPAIIIAFIPVRYYVISAWLTEHDLRYLDYMFRCSTSDKIEVNLKDDNNSKDDNGSNRNYDENDNGDKKETNQQRRNSLDTRGGLENDLDLPQLDVIAGYYTAEEDDDDEEVIHSSPTRQHHHQQQKQPITYLRNHPLKPPDLLLLDDGRKQPQQNEISSTMMMIQKKETLLQAKSSSMLVGVFQTSMVSKSTPKATTIIENRDDVASNSPTSSRSSSSSSLSSPSASRVNV